MLLVEAAGRGYRQELYSERRCWGKEPTSDRGRGADRSRIQIGGAGAMVRRAGDRGQEAQGSDRGQLHGGLGCRQGPNVFFYH